jgi:hypothetical protein
VQFDLRGERPRARRWPRAGSSLAFPKTFGRGMRLGVRAAGSARTVGPSGLCGLNPVSGIDRPCGAICGASRRARRGRFQTPASRSLPGVSEASASPSVRAAHAPSVAPKGRSLPATGFSPHRPEGPTGRAEPAARIASSTSSAGTYIASGARHGSRQCVRNPCSAGTSRGITTRGCATRGRDAGRSLRVNLGQNGRGPEAARRRARRLEVARRGRAQHPLRPWATAFPDSG